MIEIKSKREIELMREAGKVLAEVHEKVGEAVAPGKSTYELDKYAEELIRKAKCTPSFLHLYDFPAACCVSVNEELIHGIPEKTRILKEGDIVSFDIGVNYKGYHSDAARTWAVGEIAPNAKRLVETCKESFFRGIENAVPGNHLNDICGSIGDYVEAHGYGVVTQYVEIGRASCRETRHRPSGTHGSGSTQLSYEEERPEASGGDDPGHRAHDYGRKSCGQGFIQ